VKALAGVNLGVRFLLELCALTALAVWGWQAADGRVVQVLLAVAAPAVAATAWGLWVAPRASYLLADPGRLGVELLVFAAAVAGLVAVGHVTSAVVLAVVYVVNASLGFAWHQRDT
jgi:uncharacterized protein DUF2568